MLTELTNRNPGAAAAAQAIGDLVLETRRAVAVPRNNEPGRRLLEAHNTNARAALELP